jgi:hypothetical protein
VEKAVKGAPAAGLDDLTQLIKAEGLEDEFRLAPALGGQEATLERLPPSYKAEEPAVPIARTIHTQALFRDGELICVVLSGMTLRFANPVLLTHETMKGVNDRTRKAVERQPEELRLWVRRFLMSHLSERGRLKRGKRVKHALVDLDDGKAIVFSTPLPKAVAGQSVSVDVILLIPAEVKQADVRDPTPDEVREERDQLLETWEAMRIN